MEQNWSTLKKDDKLYLLVPIDIGQEKLKYVYQESQVICVHQYDWCTNIRFKYTDISGKRQRCDICINNLKYDKKYLSANIKTRWARELPIEYGDIIVTYIDHDTLDQAYLDIINNEIQKIEVNIAREKKILEDLYNNNYDYLENWQHI